MRHQSRWFVNIPSTAYLLMTGTFWEVRRCMASVWMSSQIDRPKRNHTNKQSKHLTPKTEINDSCHHSFFSPQKRYLFTPHVNKQLSAVGAEGDVGGHQNPQAVIVVREFDWQVPWSIRAITALNVSQPHPSTVFITVSLLFYWMNLIPDNLTIFAPAT